MSVYYPQGVIVLRVLLEDFSTKSVRLQKTYKWTVIAKELNVNLNNYSEADTFDCTIDYKNLPFDPRIIRSLGVSIHMENKEQIFDLKSGGGLDPITPTKDNVIFQGFADTDAINLDENSRTVKIEGRDFTSLLIDREYLGDPIFLTKPVNQVIRDLLDQIPQTKIDPNDKGQGLEIELLGIKESDLPILSALTSSKGELDGAKNARKKRSYWDKIQELVNDSGLICFVSIDKLVITKPRNLYDRSKSKVFVYGRNVKTLEFERKLGRQKGFNIRVVSLNFRDKKLEEARIPEEASEEWAKSIGVKREAVRLPVAKAAGKDNQEQGETQPEGEVAPYMTFKVNQEIVSKDQLIDIGEKIYEELGRQQIEGKLSTMEMRVFSKESGGFDSTKFRVGTPIEIRIDQGDLEGLNQLLAPAARNQEQDRQAEKSLEQRRASIVAFLKRRGYVGEKGAIAEAMAEALTAFDTPFFTKSVTFRLSQDKGFSMDLDFINFIEIPKNLVE
jgi:hypothetical protein